MRLRVQLYGTRGQATPVPANSCSVRACYIEPRQSRRKRNAIPIDATSCHT